MAVTGSGFAPQGVVFYEPPQVFCSLAVFGDLHLKGWGYRENSG